MVKCTKCGAPVFHDVKDVDVEFFNGEVSTLHDIDADRCCSCGKYFISHRGKGQRARRMERIYARKIRDVVESLESTIKEATEQLSGGQSFFGETSVIRGQKEAFEYALGLINSLKVKENNDE